MRAAFDTNILIDFLKGIPAARKELDLYEEHLISIITLIEVLVALLIVSLVATGAFSAVSNFADQRVILTLSLIHISEPTRPY